MIFLNKRKTESCDLRLEKKTLISLQAGNTRPAYVGLLDCRLTILSSNVNPTAVTSKTKRRRQIVKGEKIINEIMKIDDSR